MGVELAPVIERPKLDRQWLLDFEIASYAIDVEDLGVVQKTYSSDYVRGKKDGVYGVCVWSILTPEASQEGLQKPTIRQINQYSRRLKEEVTRFGLPLEIHTSFVRPEREQALRDHLERSKINYTY